MLKIGLTGGIGCGKSAVVHRFQYHQIPIVDADLVARQVVEPNQPALSQIAQYFGKQILTETGELKRAELRKIVFADEKQLKQLESIVQPAIRERLLAEMNHPYDAYYVVVDIPLLIEKGYKELFDRVVVVDCDPTQQIERVMRRDGSSREMVEKIMRQQIPRAERLSHADDIIDNSSTLNNLYKIVDNLHSVYQGMVCG